MSERRRWNIGADIVLAASGPAWLLGMGAEPPGDIVAVGAAWAFLTVGAPWAVVRIAHLHRRWRDHGRPFAQAPRTLVLTVCLAGALVLAGMTIGGPIGGTVVNLAGLALLAFGVPAFLAAFTPLGVVLIVRSSGRSASPGMGGVLSRISDRHAVDRRSRRFVVYPAHGVARDRRASGGRYRDTRRDGQPRRTTRGR